MDERRMPPGRAAALAPGSRLYPQAHALSDRLRQAVAQDRDWLELPLRTLTQGRAELRLSSVAEVDAALVRARQLLGDAAAGYSAYHGLPALAQAVSDTYYGGAGEDPRFGPALKLALAALWSNVERRADGPARNAAGLIHLAKLALLVDQLNTARHTLQTGGIGWVRLYSEGMLASDRVATLLNQMAGAAEERGRTFRMAKRTVETFLLRLEEGFAGVLRVLAGEAPSQVAELAGSVFAQLPGREAYAFWAGLWAHLALIIASAGHSSVVTNRQPSIALMQGTEFRLVGHVEQPELLRQALAARLWQSDWYRRQDLTIYSSLIVRRPVLAILPDRSLLVTSQMLLADALNLFVETSFMPELPGTGIPLPESAFEQLIASDFEQRVVDLFRGVGFRAGPVTLSGVWKTAEGDEDLKAWGAERPPGQIDVLALHRDSGCMLVIECKVLSLPTTGSRLRNLVGKVSEEDVEGFWANLEEKCRWMRTVGPWLTPAWTGLQGILALDRKAPGLGEVRGMMPLHYEALETVAGRLAQLFQASSR